MREMRSEALHEKLRKECRYYVKSGMARREVEMVALLSLARTGRRGVKNSRLKMLVVDFVEVY